MNGRVQRSEVRCRTVLPSGLEEAAPSFRSELEITSRLRPFIQTKNLDLPRAQPQNSLANVTGRAPATSSSPDGKAEVLHLTSDL
jgi:hypothetical protein